MKHLILILEMEQLAHDHKNQGEGCQSHTRCHDGLGVMGSVATLFQHPLGFGCLMALLLDRPGILIIIVGVNVKHFKSPFDNICWIIFDQLCCLR
jgi:hypothetical protein